MKNRVRKTVCTVVLLLFSITFTVNGMKRAADNSIVPYQPPSKRYQIAEILKRPYDFEDPKLFENQKFMVKGTLFLARNITALGFGDMACITDLNKAGISAEYNWPLIPTKAVIPQPKKNPQDTTKFTIWTDEALPDIAQKINTVVENQLEREQREISSLITLEDRDTWLGKKTQIDLKNRNKDMRKSAQRTIEQFRCPCLIPVQYLFARNIKLRLFDCCDAEFTFDQHELLDEHIEQFYKKPGMFTHLDDAIKYVYKQIRKTQTLPPADREEMAKRQETLRHFRTILKRATKKDRAQTEKELKEKGLFQDTLYDRETFQMFCNNNTLYHTNNGYKLGVQCPDIRDLVLTHNLKENPFVFVQNRQIGFKK